MAWKWENTVCASLSKSTPSFKYNYYFYDKNWYIKIKKYLDSYTKDLKQVYKSLKLY